MSQDAERCEHLLWQLLGAGHWHVTFSALVQQCFHCKELRHEHEFENALNTVDTVLYVRVCVSERKRERVSFVNYFCIVNLMA